MKTKSQLSKSKSNVDLEQQGLTIEEQLHKEVVDLVSNPEEFYNHYALNFIIDLAISSNDQTRVIPLEDDHNFSINLPINLWNFQQSGTNSAVIPIRPVNNQGHNREHFAGIYIQSSDDGYNITYIDPTGSSDVNDIPQHVRQSLFEVLGVSQEEINSTSNKIQHRTSTASEGIEYLTNVHCGAFTGFILSGLALNNIRVDSGRLQIITTEGWQDIPDLNEEQSNSFGTEIRRQNLKILTGELEEFAEITIERSSNKESNADVEEITAGMDSLAKKVAAGDADQYYKLKRSDSDMSQYSDLVDEMLQDQLDPKFTSKQREYDVMDVKIKNPQIVQIDQNIKVLESANKSLGQKARHNKITAAEKNQQQQANKQQKTQLTAVKKTLPAEQERTYEGEDANKKMHIFRGKNLNNVILDPSTGQERVRTKKEKEDYVTRKYAGKPIYSDGTWPITNDQDRLRNSENVTRGYIRGIKDGTQNKSLFGAGTSYSKAVKHLMSITQLNGNPVVAATKFPWVAAEYMVGQMGGAAGGDRNTEFGYQEDGKPVNRVLGNGFAMSLSLSDYKGLRDGNDLIDVNLDIPGKGMECNRMIEEITFVSKIDGQFVKGSLPMVLPRLDRNWGDMSREKHAQYRRVFGFDKSHYEHFQTLLETDESYPLGTLTEFLIQYHGNLLREIAINSDRKDGYQGKFVATQDSSQAGGYHGDLDDLNHYGKKLQSRDARTGSSGKSSSYMTRENSPSTPDKLEDRLFNSDNTPLLKSNPRDNEENSSSLEDIKLDSSITKILFTSPKKSKSGGNGSLDTMSSLDSALPLIAPSKKITKASGSNLVSLGKSNSQLK